MPDDGRPTAIFKKPVSGPLEIGLEGIQGDQQADRRVHGGPEKAVHFYPADHYARLAQAFPNVTEKLIPGSMGENLSSPGLVESDVCVGDVFRLGSARLQVCQPRSPCWKIDARFGQEGMAAHIAETGLTGWYFRIKEPGRIVAGDALTLDERADKTISLAEAREIWNTHRPGLADLERIAGVPGIAANWRKKVLGRLEWLRREA